MDRTSATDDEAVTREVLSAPGGERCTNCQSPLASDQRYCIGCGERRGRARFSFEALTAPPAPPPAAPQKSRPHVSSSFSLIAGVATLLLAMGVGVLIGHNSTTKATQAAAPSQVIKIEGGGGSGSGSTGGAAAKTATKSAGFKAPKVKLSPKVVKAVNNAAQKVLGSSAAKNLSQNPTQQVGGSCSGGVGCQSGKFTGNYFGQ